MTVLESRVRGLLIALGETEDVVVKTLKRRGIKGEPYEGPSVPKNAKPNPKYASASCPIGNYLRVSDVPEARVSRHFTWVRGRDRKWRRVDNTAAVAVFIMGFDGGDYPELES